MLETASVIMNELSLILCKKKIKDIIASEVLLNSGKSSVTLIVKTFLSENSIFNIQVLNDYNLTLKFVSVNEEYKCHESISFPHVSLRNVLFEEWESKDELLEPSLLKNLKKIYIFIPIIKSKSKGRYNDWLDWEIGVLSFWSPNSKEIKAIGEEWNKARGIIKKGVILTTEKYGMGKRVRNNLLKQSESNFIHLRPHGKNALDYDRPYREYTNGKIEITKQSFWLNKKYVNYLLKEYKWKMSLKEE